MSELSINVDQSQLELKQLYKSHSEHYTPICSYAVELGEVHIVRYKGGSFYYGMRDSDDPRGGHHCAYLYVPDMDETVTSKYFHLIPRDNWWHDILFYPRWDTFIDRPPKGVMIGLDTIHDFNIDGYMDDIDILKDIMSDMHKYMLKFMDRYVPLPVAERMVMNYKRMTKPRRRWYENDLC